MAAIIQVPVDDPDVNLFRPHDPNGYWTIEVDGVRRGPVRWHASQDCGEVQMTARSLRALRDALNRELADAPPPLTVPTMDANLPFVIHDADSVPVGYPARLNGDPAEDAPTLVLRGTTPMETQP